MEDDELAIAREVYPEERVVVHRRHCGRHEGKLAIGDGEDVLSAIAAHMMAKRDAADKDVEQLALMLCVSKQSLVHLLGRVVRRVDLAVLVVLSSVLGEIYVTTQKAGKEKRARGGMCSKTGSAHAPAP